MKNKINVTVSTIFTYSDTYEQDIVENSMSFNADRLKDIKEHQLIATLIIEDESFFEMPFMKAIFSRMGKYFFNEKSELIEDAIKQHALGHISKAVMKAEKERFKKMFVQKVS
jgi:hypothetical protein